MLLLSNLFSFISNEMKCDLSFNWLKKVTTEPIDYSYSILKN